MSESTAANNESPAPINEKIPKNPEERPLPYGWTSYYVPAYVLALLFRALYIEAVHELTALQRTLMVRFHHRSIELNFSCMLRIYILEPSPSIRDFSTLHPEDLAPGQKWTEEERAGEVEDEVRLWPEKLNSPGYVKRESIFMRRLDHMLT
jgi:hypothetical protein